jgi:hypothetical protein
LGEKMKKPLIDVITVKSTSNLAEVPSLKSTL